MNDRDKRAVIYEIQSRLLTLSRAYPLPRVVPDGIYGRETRDAVAEFQKYAGLAVTGVVDYDTWNALYEAERRVLEASAPPMMISPFDTLLEGGTIRLEDRFPTIYIIQAMLEELAQLYDYTEPVAINGVFDSATESAVKMIQRSLDLDGDGIVDIVTWNGMARLYNSLQSGNIDSSGT